MSPLRAALVALGVLMVVYGVAALLVTLARPQWMDASRFGDRMLLGRAPSMRGNRLLMAAWHVVVGLYLSLSAAEVMPWKYVAMVLLMAVGLPVVRLQWRSRG